MGDITIKPTERNRDVVRAKGLRTVLSLLQHSSARVRANAALVVANMALTGTPDRDLKDLVSLVRWAFSTDFLGHGGRVVKTREALILAGAVGFVVSALSHDGSGGSGGGGGEQGMTFEAAAFALQHLAAGISLRVPMWMIVGAVLSSCWVVG